MKTYIKKEPIGRKTRKKATKKILLQHVEGMKKCNINSLWWAIKSQQRENIGDVPLQTKKGKIAKDNKEKTDILNRKFQSVFTHDYSNPMVMPYLKFDGPEYPQINNFTINVRGVETLFLFKRNWKSTKGQAQGSANILCSLGYACLNMYLLNICDVTPCSKYCEQQNIYIM